MGWNYRVCRTQPTPREPALFSIREVYYDATTDEPDGYSNASVEYLESLDDLRGTLVKMLAALDKPVLEDPL